jgi:Zn-finger nucleic acid-binding protein
MSRSCPRCASSLVDRGFGSVTLDGCTCCGGIWFDIEELSKLTRDPATGMMEVERAFQPAVSGVETTGKMECPKCALPLYAFNFPHTPDVQLDACRKCKGIWADDGELQKIAERVEAARPATRPMAQSPAGLNTLDAGRQQMRTITSFLITRPCPGCHQNNPSAAVVCWACGLAMQTMGATSLCPRCDRNMTEFTPEQSPSRLDACLTCKGIWFAGGELSTFLQFGLGEIQSVRQRIGDGLGHFVDRDVNETRMLSCPDCNFCMERDTLGTDSLVMIDVCPTCRGVWLDAGELIAAYEYFQAGGVPGARNASDPWK